MFKIAMLIALVVATAMTALVYKYSKHRKGGAFISALVVLFGGTFGVGTLIFAIALYAIFPGPWIDVSQPTPGQLIDSQETTIKGSVHGYNNDMILTINDQPLTVGADGNFETTVTLPSVRSDFKLVLTEGEVLNEYTVSIKRERTPEEQTEYDQAVADKEQRKQDEAEQAAAEDEAWKQTPAGKLCAQDLTWSKDDCENAINDKIWIGMDYDMLVYLNGEPDSSNVSNYGSGNQYQYCWWNQTPNCYYDANNDGLIDSYN